MHHGSETSPHDVDQPRSPERRGAATRTNTSFGDRIIKRVLISAIVGVAAGWSIVLPLTLAASQHFEFHNDYWITPGNFPDIVTRSVLGAPLGVLFGLTATSPLIAMAVVVALVFRRSIERHLGLWCLAAPLAVWVVWCTFDASVRENDFFRAHGWPTRLWTTFTGVDNLLFLFAPMAASTTFYLLFRWSRKGCLIFRHGRSAGDARSLPYD